MEIIVRNRLFISNQFSKYFVLYNSVFKIYSYNKNQSLEKQPSFFYTLIYKHAFHKNMLLNSR